METENLYTNEFYDNMFDSNNAVAIKFMPYIIEKLNPRSIVDVGGGQGIFLAVAKKYGIDDILCIDGSYVDTEKLLIDKKEFLQFDLTTKCRLERKFDMALSLEVAEHIAPQYVDVFIDNLVNLSDVIVFSAAIPKQGGTGHVNEQWMSYWIKKFSDKGYKVSNCLRNFFWKEKNIKPIRRQNILLFIRNEKAEKLTDRFKKDAGDIFDLVHPEVYMEKISYLEKRVSDLEKILDKNKRFIRSVITENSSTGIKSVSKWNFWMAVDNLDFLYENFNNEKQDSFVVLEELESFERKIGSRNYILFGAGKDGRKIKRLLELLGKNIVKWCDTNLVGSVLDRYKIVSPEDACSNYNGEIIVIASRNNYKEIKKQILKYNINLEAKIFN